MPTSLEAGRERRIGFLVGTAAYGLWGLFPIYLKALASVRPLEILSHRIVWAAVILACLVWQQRLGGHLRSAIRSRRSLGGLLGSTVAIGVNWLVYISAVLSGHVLETSLGYFMTPLVSVLLGVVVLRERLSRPVRWAAALAAIGVVCMTLQAGRVPVIALTLAFSFGSYGLLRKVVPVGAAVGLAVETLLLLPFAASFLIWSRSQGTLAFLAGAASRDALLLFSGVITAGPLLLFAGAVRRLPLSTVGFLQYISPTIQFLLAVFLYREPFTSGVALAFGFIWTGLGVFAAHSIRAARSRGAGELPAPHVPAQEPA